MIWVPCFECPIVWIDTPWLRLLMIWVSHDVHIHNAGILWCGYPMMWIPLNVTIMMSHDNVPWGYHNMMKMSLIVRSPMMRSPDECVPCWGCPMINGSTVLWWVSPWVSWLVSYDEYVYFPILSKSHDELVQWWVCTMNTAPWLVSHDLVGIDYVSSTGWSINRTTSFGSSHGWSVIGTIVPWVPWTNLGEQLATSFPKYSSFSRWISSAGQLKVVFSSVSWFVTCDCILKRLADWQCGAVSDGYLKWQSWWSGAAERRAVLIREDTAAPQKGERGTSARRGKIRGHGAAPTSHLLLPKIPLNIFFFFDFWTRGRCLFLSSHCIVIGAIPRDLLDARVVINFAPWWTAARCAGLP